ncbi:hypothetical protein AB0L42_03505 [Streptomyces sp. NPDC052287]
MSHLKNRPAAANPTLTGMLEGLDGDFDAVPYAIEDCRAARTTTRPRP